MEGETINDTRDTTPSLHSITEDGPAYVDAVENDRYEGHTKDTNPDSTESVATGRGKFRFKDKSKRRSKDKYKDEFGHKNSSKRKHSPVLDEEQEEQRHSRKRRSKGAYYPQLRSAKTKKQTWSTSAWDNIELNADGTYNDPDTTYESSKTGNEDPETAFRESLFDAMADDEGTAYWADLYDHQEDAFSKTKSPSADKLEEMTHEEYAAWMRREMFMKTHGAKMAEREARNKAYQEKKRKEEKAREETERLNAEHVRWQEKMWEKIRATGAENLKEAEKVRANHKEREERQKMSDAWAKYTLAWAALRENNDLADESTEAARRLIPWPVHSGKPKDISQAAVERFLKGSGEWDVARTALLKAERVRWHPDKMQQRFGQHLDTTIMKAVTAVFQIIDKLWDENRNNA